MYDLVNQLDPAKNIIAQQGEVGHKRHNKGNQEKHRCFLTGNTHPAQ
jgi:hypothetical protein